MNESQRPRIMALPINAVTSFQLINPALLLVWTVVLFTQHEQIQNNPEFETLWRILPRAWWWAWITLGIFLLNVLPLVPVWVRHINSTFRTKYVGLLLSAVWWMFIAAMFLILAGLDVGFGVHLILGLGATFELMRLVRRSA